jgi:hypothetical protein
MAWRADSVLRRSRSFNAPLAAALPRFATSWGALSQALVMQRAKRVFHVCAALVAVGFVAGLLVRGEVLRDHAAGVGITPGGRAFFSRQLCATVREGGSAIEGSGGLVRGAA